MLITEHICGIDEAGRGPWAGPVTAGAVVLDPAHPIAGLTDSKKLTAKRREALVPLIRDGALAYGIAHISAGQIDTLNIRRATHLAMAQAAQAAADMLAAKGLSALSHALIDGNDIPPGLPCSATAIVKGDLTEPAISAASILAKTARDHLLVQLDGQYPGYGFAGHKGYGTAAHAEALSRLGPCPQHRRSFAPVRRALIAADLKG